MNKPMENRYVPSWQIFSLHHGALHYGKDLFLNRAVILYTVECPPGQSGKEYVARLSSKASFHHAGFHHILDTSFDERSVLIVLEVKPGKLFLDEYKTKMWTYSNVIKLVTDLGVSMLDAMEKQITGFSIGIENLWMGEDGRISIINYWDEGEPHKQGAIGLCRLLIQIFSGANEIPGPFEALHTRLERVHIPAASPAQKESLIQLIKIVCQGQASLSTLIFGLRELPLETHIDEAEIPSTPARTVNSSGMPRADQRTASKDKENISLEDTDTEKDPSRFYKWVGAGVFSLVFMIFLVWLLSSSPFQKRDESVIPTDFTKPKGNSGPSNTPEPQQIQPSATANNQQNAPGQTKEVIVPNLVGLTQSDAEKQALSAGLHYNFNLEANEQAKGTVFKQEPVAGTKVLQGDNVTFWVGK